MILLCWAVLEPRRMGGWRPRESLQSALESEQVLEGSIGVQEDCGQEKTVCVLEVSVPDGRGLDYSHSRG